MNFITRYRYLLMGIAVGSVVVYLVSSITTERKLSQLQVSLEDSIESARAEVLFSVTEVGSGGYSNPPASIIADCSATERDSFESYLAKLDLGLTLSELKEVDLLFSRCAPVQSVRRTLMVMDLSRRLEKFDALVLQRKQISVYTRYDNEIARLKELVAYEEDITEVSFDLVYLQREIIDALLNGESVYSERSKEFKDRGVTLRTELSQRAQAAIQLRQELLES